MNIPLALRLVKCGLPMPIHANRLSCLILSTLQDGDPLTKEHVGLGGCDPATRLMFTVVATDDGPQLLPVLDDYAVYGWLIQKFRTVYGALASTTPNTHEPAAQLWSTYAEDGHEITSGPTEIEAIVLALEAALAAGKVVAVLEKHISQLQDVE